MTEAMEHRRPGRPPLSSAGARRSIHISVDPELLEAIHRLANRDFNGNVSALIAQACQDFIIQQNLKDHADG